jgi:hypothetical protein
MLEHVSLPLPIYVVSHVPMPAPRRLQALSRTLKTIPRVVKVGIPTHTCSETLANVGKQETRQSHRERVG